MNCPNCGKKMSLSFTVVSYSSMEVMAGNILSKKVTHEMDERVQPSYRCECGNNVYVDYKDVKREIQISNVYIPDKTLSVPAVLKSEFRYPIKEAIRKSGRKKVKRNVV